MDKELKNDQMDLSTKEHGKIIILTDEESLFDIIKTTTKENGKKA